MTKVSMRHLNEIVRERNQYSRDAMEAWQDFINLKGRMDTELSKVTKRNNFLVEELESWKQQFLKFQAFAEQLTKETQELKVKIENHKRENRRLTSLIDQQKDDHARLNNRLSGTEKQRDDALEALVLQQEIAEELERERKRNKKELAALQHTNTAIVRQRDEAQRVVLHLRALIDGQAHHMEHIVKSLGQSPELSEYIEDGYDVPEEDEEPEKANGASDEGRKAAKSMLAEVGKINGVLGVSSRVPSRAASRASTVDGKHLDGEDVSPDMETRLLNSPMSRKRLSQLSMADVADRHLRDKTDAIAYIIRNISEQCAAAVEGLHLAQRAEGEEEIASHAGDKHKVKRHRATDSGDQSRNGGSEFGDNDNASTAGSSVTNSSYLHPRHGRESSVPPTPDLIHPRSSTSMSMASASTTPERHSVQTYKTDNETPDVPTRIVEDEGDTDERMPGAFGSENGDAMMVENPVKYGPGVTQRGVHRIGAN